MAAQQCGQVVAARVPISSALAGYVGYKARVRPYAPTPVPLSLFVGLIQARVLVSSAKGTGMCHGQTIL